MFIKFMSLFIMLCVFSSPAISSDLSPPLSSIKDGEVFHYYYEHHFNKDFDCCEFNVGTALKNTTNHHLESIAWVNIMKEIDFASNVGKQWVDVKVPYNEVIFKDATKELKHRGFTILKSVYRWSGDDGSTPPYLIVTWNKSCRLTSKMSFWKASVICSN
jgi:hypothetical protein